MTNISKFEQMKKDLEETKDTLPLEYTSNLDAFHYCLENRKTNLIIQFDDSLFTNEIIEKYADVIVDSINNEFPYTLRRSPILLKACFYKNRNDLILRFGTSCFNEEIISKYWEEIMNILDEKQPKHWFRMANILGLCLDKNRSDLFQKFDKSAFTEEIINQYGDYIIVIIEEKFSNTIPDNLKTNKFLFQRYVSLKKYELSLQFEDILFYDVLDNPQYLDFITRKLEITSRELNHKLEYLHSKNSDIFKTLRIEMLSRKMSYINLDEIERFAAHKDIQDKLISLQDVEIKVISKLLDRLRDESYDLASIIYHVIDNISNYHNLLMDINIDSLSDEELKNLLFTLQMKTNLYEINSYLDLTDINYQQKEDIYFRKIEDAIKDNSVDIYSLKEALLMKKYGLNMEKAQFICKRYCHNMEELRSSRLPKEVFNILESINNIYCCDSLEQLKFLYMTSKRLRTDFYTTISLEASIRKEYAKMFSDSLYKVRLEHKLDENHELFLKNRGVYDLLTKANYHGKKPTFYILDGDFNLQIHTLGAYGSIYTRPDNFMEAWSKPKIAYHGICTSYIGNNQIAGAKGETPVYGFSQYESGSLLLMGNYDLGSSGAISSYATSMYDPYSFYPPEKLIKYTRHNHNEIVLERRNSRNTGNSFKRNPDYLVYFVDDINQMGNYSEENNLYNETIQAAVDFGIPIVIVDRLKYAKSELDKCTKLEAQFVATKDITILEELFISYLTNMVGCKNFNIENRREYHDYFNEEKFDQFFSRLLNLITDESMDYERQLQLMNFLKYLINRELTIQDNQYLFYMVDKLVEVNYLIAKIENAGMSQATLEGNSGYGKN